MQIGKYLCTAKRGKAILRRLQEMSVMDIESAAEDEEISALPEGFTKTDTEDRVAAYERNAEPPRRL